MGILIKSSRSVFSLLKCVVKYLVPSERAVSEHTFMQGGTHISADVAWSLNRSVKTAKNVKKFYTMTSEMYRGTIYT